MIIDFGRFGQHHNNILLFTNQALAW